MGTQEGIGYGEDYRHRQPKGRRGEKLTTAVNLSAAMGERGHKTLLVDIDPQGNASSGWESTAEAWTSPPMNFSSGGRRERGPGADPVSQSSGSAKQPEPGGGGAGAGGFQHRESRLKTALALSGRNTSICLLTAPRRWGLSPPTPSAPPIPCWFPFSANITPWRA